MSERLQLSSVIDALRQELLDLHTTVEGESIRFDVDEVEVELQVSVTLGGEAEAKARFWVFTEASAVASLARETVQTVRLKLKPRTKTGGEIQVSRGV